MRRFAVSVQFMHRPLWIMHSFLLLLLAFGQSTASATTTTVYCIRAAAYASAQQAEDARAAYAQTCSPVFVRETTDGAGTTYNVCVGNFRWYAEAWAYQAKLGSWLPSDNQIIQCDWESQPIMPPVLPLEMPFQTDGMSVGDPLNIVEYLANGGFNEIPEPSASTMSADPATLNRDQLLLVGMSAPRHLPEGIRALERFLAAFPTDPEINRAKLTLARVLGRGSDFNRAEALLSEVGANADPVERVMVRYLSAYEKYAKKQFPESYEAFREFASDRAVPPRLRLDAMRRAAGIAYRLRDYPNAWLTFAQIVECAPGTPTAADAQVQLAGIAFELVGRGHGSWDDVAVLCRQAEDNSAASKRDRSTAALMHLEQLYERGRYSEALAEAQVFCETYSDVPREYYLARLWEGIFLYKLGLVSQAQTSLENLVGQTIPSGEKFAGVEPRARALIWLAWICHEQKNIASRDRWLKVLSTEFPNTDENRRAVTYFAR